MIWSSTTPSPSLTTTISSTPRRLLRHHHHRRCRCTGHAEDCTRACCWQLQMTAMDRTGSTTETVGPRTRASRSTDVRGGAATMSYGSDGPGLGGAAVPCSTWHRSQPRRSTTVRARCRCCPARRSLAMAERRRGRDAVELASCGHGGGRRRDLGRRCPRRRGGRGGQRRHRRRSGECRGARSRHSRARRSCRLRRRCVRAARRPHANSRTTRTTHAFDSVVVHQQRSPSMRRRRYQDGS